MTYIESGQNATLRVKLNDLLNSSSETTSWINTVQFVEGMTYRTSSYFNGALGVRFDYCFNNTNADGYCWMRKDDTQDDGRGLNYAPFWYYTSDVLSVPLCTCNEQRSTINTQNN